MVKENTDLDKWAVERDTSQRKLEEEKKVIDCAKGMNINGYKGKIKKERGTTLMTPCVVTFIYLYVGVCSVTQDM